MLGITEIVGFGKETVRNTAVASSLQLPCINNSFQPTLQGHYGRGSDTASFPDMRESVGLGRTPSFRFQPTFTVNTCKDILGMALDRAAGVLKSFTVFGTPATGLGEKFSGSVCRNLTLEFSRSDNPDAAALLSSQMDFLAMDQPTDADLATGTIPVGNRFVLHQSTFTINSVAYSRITQFRYSISNTLIPSVHSSTFALLDIDDGERAQELDLTARFTDAAWRALVKSLTDIPVVIVLQTGTATQTLTLTIAHANVDMIERGGGAGMITAQIKIIPNTVDAGTTKPVVISYGAGCGASALTLVGTG